MPSLPPLIVLAEGRKARPRKALRVRPKEVALHMQVAHLLRRTARPEWRWTHFPAGEHRNPRTGAKLKAMGLNPGWPDFLIVAPGGVAHFLELKREGGGLSEAQQQMQIWAAAQGVPFSVARTFDDALAVLTAWGAIIAKG
ncbi:MAG: VRR-NUC domain-containing protein [Methylocystis sp.]|nr:VRR-NUC domain-containing protein [Methylocystis sp.]